MKQQDISRLKQNRAIYLKIGFIFALSTVIFAFNYTVYDYNNIEMTEPEGIQEPDVEVIRTPREKKPLPPPPAIDISKEIVEIESPEFIEEPEPEPIEIPLEVAVETIVKAPRPAKAIAPKPKPKPTFIPEDKAEPMDNTIYTIVESMPEFGDCGTSSDKNERKQISTKNLMTFIYKHIKYPRMALENGIAGRVIVRFVVDKEGQIQNAEILREPGGGLGKEVLRVIDEMPLWKAGKQGRHNVKVQYTMPVEFKAL